MHHYICLKTKVINANYYKMTTNFIRNPIIKLYNVIKSVRCFVEIFLCDVMFKVISLKVNV